MNRNEIIEKLTAIFHEIFKDDTIVLSDEMTSNDVDAWDSLTHMLMITSVEEQFGIRFKLKDLNSIKNVGDIVRIIGERLS